MKRLIIREQASGFLQTVTLEAVLNFSKKFFLA